MLYGNIELVLIIKFSLQNSFKTKKCINILLTIDFWQWSLLWMYKTVRIKILKEDTFTKKDDFRKWLKLCTINNLNIDVWRTLK